MQIESEYAILDFDGPRDTLIVRAESDTLLDLRVLIVRIRVRGPSVHFDVSQSKRTMLLVRLSTGKF